MAIVSPGAEESIFAGQGAVIGLGGVGLVLAPMRDTPGTLLGARLTGLDFQQIGVAAALWNVVPTVAGAVVAGGVYLAVDFALITQVLPRAGDRARDLGVINIANALPQVLAPALAGPIITWSARHGTHADGYRTLYLLAAAIGVAAALLIRKIRSVD